MFLGTRISCDRWAIVDFIRGQRRSVEATVLYDAIKGRRGNL